MGRHNGLDSTFTRRGLDSSRSRAETSEQGPQRPSRGCNSSETRSVQLNAGAGRHTARETQGQEREGLQSVEGDQAPAQHKQRP